MTTTYSPDGLEYSHSKNLRGLISNAKSRGVSGISIESDDEGGCHVSMTHKDGFFSKTHFASASVCDEFLRKRWSEYLQPAIKRPSP